MSEHKTDPSGPSMNPLPQSSTTTSTVPQGANSSPSSAAAIDSTDKAQAQAQSTSNSSTPNTADLNTKKQPWIPKLSATTTEVLARVNGYISGGNNRSNLGENNHVSGLNAYDPLKSESDATGLNKTRMPSAVIELPKAPFQVAGPASTAAATPAPAPTPAVSNNNADLTNNKEPRKPPQDPAKLIPIAPKLVKTQTNHPPQMPMQPQVHINPANVAPAPAAAPAPAPAAATATATTISPTNGSSPKPPKPTPNSRKRKTAPNNTRRNVTKRRRGNDSDGDDVIRAADSSTDDDTDPTPTATQTKSGRQVNRPSLYVPPPATMSNNGRGNANADPANTGDGETTKSTTAAPSSTSRKRRRVYRKGKDAYTYINCCHCQRSHSPSTNTIVLCDECNDAWHQSCHDPPIDDDVITIKEKRWVCRDCKPVPYRITQPTVVRSNPYPDPSSDRRRVQVPLQPPLVLPQREVGGEVYSADERRRYLSSLSHATLVELLVTLSDCHSSLAMFPANLRELQLSKFPWQQGTSTVSVNDPAVSGPKEASTTAAPSSAAGSARNRRDSESSDESDYEQYVEHRLYPRAGNGFRLPLDAGDLDILREDPDCATFSHALHGPAKARSEANEAVPVWGAA